MNSGISAINEEVQKAAAFVPTLFSELNKVVIGQKYLVERLAIGLLAIGLVIATTLAVGLVFKWLVPECPWAAAFVLGAMLAGLFLGFAEVLSVAYIGSTMRDAVAFGLLFAVLLLLNGIGTGAFSAPNTSLMMGVAPPAHPLSYYKALRYPYAPGHG